MTDEKTRKYQKEWKDSHKEETREYQREYQKRYRQLHPEKMKQLYKKRYKNNPTFHKESCKEWRMKNPEKANECQRTYCAYKRKTDPRFRIAETCRGRIRRAIEKITKGKGRKHFHSMELLGCTLDELRLHLEQRWAEGMSWSNYGYNGWHIDHIVPCSAFDLTDPVEQKQCFHYTNLQPLWAKDNLLKSDRV